MRNTIWLAILALCCSFGLAQEEAKEWRGLILGETTPQEARSEMGDPVKIKEKQKLGTEARRWIDRKRRYQRFEYKKWENLKKVRLYFHNGLLAAIEFEPNYKLKAFELRDRYGMRLYPLVLGLRMTGDPENWEPDNRYREALDYPALYHLLGVGLEVFVDVTVGFDGLLKNLAENAGGGFGGDFTPGRAMKIQLMARWLVQ